MSVRASFATTAARLFTGWLLIVPPAAASDAVFDFRVDRFEIDGNSLGPDDGVPDFVSEFEDIEAQKIPGDWSDLFGHIFFGGGFLHLTSPGTKAANGFGALPGTTIVISAAQLFKELLNGRGNFTARSYWEPQEFRPGDVIHMTFGNAGPGSVAGTFVFDLATIALRNATPDGMPTRYDVTQALARLPADDGVPVHDDVFSIDPATITGQIVFSMSFDDATDTIQTSISLDGGQTFQSPFSPLPVFHQVSYGSFLLGADPLADRPPCGSGVPVTHARTTLRTRRRTPPSLQETMRVALPAAYDPIRDGAQVRITAGDTSLVDLTGATVVPPGEPSTGCDRRDGWVKRRSRFEYRNFSNALPPRCEPGSAQGLTSLRFDTKRRRVALGVRPLGGPPLATDRVLTVTLIFGQTAEAAATGRCASVKSACDRRGARLRCD